MLATDVFSATLKKCQSNAFQMNLHFVSPAYFRKNSFKYEMSCKTVVWCWEMYFSLHKSANKSYSVMQIIQFGTTKIPNMDKALDSPKSKIAFILESFTVLLY